MAKQLKTLVNDSSVDKYLDKVEPEQKRDDCRAIKKMMEEVSGEPAKMWGTSIIGCGSYHYEYESGHSGDMCTIGFAPRKQNIVLYIGDMSEYPAEIKKLGKVKTSKACVYFNKLADLDEKVLRDLMKKSLKKFKVKS